MLDDHDIIEGLRSVARTIDTDAAPVDLAELRAKSISDGVDAPRGVRRSKARGDRRRTRLVAVAASVLVVVGVVGLGVVALRDPDPSSTTSADPTVPAFEEPLLTVLSSPEPAASSAPGVSDGAALESVLDPPAGYLRAMNTAREAATQTCMATAGFEYQLAPNLEDIPTDGSEFVEFNEWDAWRSEQIARTPGFEAALFGTDGDGPDSCTGKANDAIYGELSGEAAALQLRSDRTEQAREAARRDDTLEPLRVEVARCVTQAGYPTTAGADDLFSTIDTAVLQGFDPVEQCPNLTELNNALDPLIAEQEQVWNAENRSRFEAVADEWNDDLRRFETASV